MTSLCSVCQPISSAKTIKFRECTTQERKRRKKDCKIRKMTECLTTFTTLLSEVAII